MRRHDLSQNMGIILLTTLFVGKSMFSIRCCMFMNVKNVDITRIKPE